MILTIFKKFEEVTSVLFMVMLTVVIIVQVFCRYCLNYSLDWPEELARHLCIATVYIGISYAEQQDKHLAVTILRTNGGAWCARYLPFISQIITVIFCGTMTWWGIRMIPFVQSSNQVAPALQIPIWIIYTVIPIGMFCMTIRALEKLVRLFHTSDSINHFDQNGRGN